jgi:hypothetical protein
MNNRAAFLPLTGQQEERKKRIMTVDDEDVVFSLNELLQENGLFEVDGFTDPQHALSNFRPGKMILLYWI